EARHVRALHIGGQADRHLEGGDGVLHVAVDIANRHRVAQAAHTDALNDERAVVGAGLDVGQEEFLRGVHEWSLCLVGTARSGRSGRCTKSIRSIGATAALSRTAAGCGAASATSCGCAAGCEEPATAGIENIAVAANSMPARTGKSFAFIAVSWTVVDDDTTIGQRSRTVNHLSRTN